MLKGFKQSCDAKVLAGVMEVCLAQRSAVKGVEWDTEDLDAIKAITLAGSEYFVKYQFKEDECEFQENYASENGTYVVTQNLIFKLKGMSPETRAAVEEIAKASTCGIEAVVSRKTHNILVGYDTDYQGERPLRLGTTTGTTGKALADATGEEITLTRTSTVKAHYYLGTLEALLAPEA